MFSLFFLVGCESERPPIFEPTTIPPTAPSTLSGLMDVLTSGSAEARITAAMKVLSLSKDERVLMIPKLVENLDYKDSSDVRRLAALILGEIGPDAQIGVQDLIRILNEDNALRVRIAAAEALGKIGSLISIPQLVGNLNSENQELAIVSAISIGQISGEDFTDINSEHGYVLNDDGVPLIVIDAKAWWENEGKFQYWDE